jgi:hypothetical protein
MLKFYHLNYFRCIFVCYRHNESVPVKDTLINLPCKIMADTDPKKKSLKMAKMFAFVGIGFLALVVVIIILSPASLDLKNPKQRVFKPAEFTSMKKFVEESVSPDGKGYSSKWKDSTLIINNKVSEVVGNKDNDYDANIRPTSLGDNSIGVIISSSFDDATMSASVYQTYMDEIAKHYAANN